MDFWGTVGVLFRRWYVALPAFLLVLAGAAGVYARFPKTYTSTSAFVLMIPPSGGSLPTDPEFPNPLTNPLVNFDAGLGLSASLLIQALSTAEVAAKVGVPPGGRTTYTISNGTTNQELMISLPYIVVTAEAPTPEEAHRVVVRINELAKEELVRQQRALQAPPATYLTTLQAVPPTAPVEKTGSRLRALVVALAMGCFLSLAATFAVENWAFRRRAYRDEDGESPSRADAPTASAGLEPAAPLRQAPSAPPAHGPVASLGQAPPAPPAHGPVASPGHG
ncbi:hypothetical protein ACFY05_16540 [Microtetraspora fusca]|uniref:Polysaccharide chain length determinant N-terminal domain-containing protein n=1 Tax=Microtetraspora fusca TaxID=1997 RepID=A0ABW6V5E4_MICFU